jgi:histidyl-tRNA synthetase
VAHFDETAAAGYALAAHLRAALPPRSGVEFHPLSARLKKQLAYADEQGIAILVIPGPDEVANGNVTLRNMKTGDQATLPLADPAAIATQCSQWLGNPQS